MFQALNFSSIQLSLSLVVTVVRQQVLIHNLFSLGLYLAIILPNKYIAVVQATSFLTTVLLLLNLLWFLNAVEDSAVILVLAILHF